MNADHSKRNSQAKGNSHDWSGSRGRTQQFNKGVPNSVRCHLKENTHTALLDKQQPGRAPPTSPCTQHQMGLPRRSGCHAFTVVWNAPESRATHNQCCVLCQNFNKHSLLSISDGWHAPTLAHHLNRSCAEPTNQCSSCQISDGQFLNHRKQHSHETGLHAHKFHAKILFDGVHCL